MVIKCKFMLISRLCPWPSSVSHVTICVQFAMEMCALQPLHHFNNKSHSGACNWIAPKLKKPWLRYQTSKHMVGHRFQSSDQLTQAQNASTLVNRVQEIKIAFLFLFATAILRWCSVNQINHVTIDTRERRKCGFTQFFHSRNENPENPSHTQ